MRRDKSLDLATMPEMKTSGIWLRKIFAVSALKTRNRQIIYLEKR